MIHFRSITRTGVLLFAAMLLTGCIGGRSPAVQFHNLSPMVTASGAPGVDPGPAVAVGPVIFPRSLRRSQLSLIHISEPTRLNSTSRMPSSA